MRILNNKTMLFGGENLKIKRIIATVLFVLPVLAIIVGAVSFEDIGGASGMGQFIGLLIPIIVGLLLLKSTKKDEIKQSKNKEENLE